MDQKFKLKLEEDSCRIAEEFSGKEASSSEQEISDSMKDEKKPRRRQKRVPISQFESSDWLINLIKLNPFKMKQIIEWIHSLLELINEQPCRYVQHLISLELEAFHSSKTAFLIYFYEINPVFYSLKLRDINGLVISVKKNEKKNKAADLLDLLKKIGNSVTTVIFDHSQETSYIQQLISTYNMTNIVFVSKYPLNLCLGNQQKKTRNYIRKEGEDCYYHYYSFHKINKKINLHQLIANFIDIEKDDSVKIRKALNPAWLSVESHSLLANIIRELGESTKKQKIVDVLKNGMMEVNRHFARWQQTTKDHFPKPSSAEKGLCFNCKRKKSEATCRGCNYIYEQQVHLCIRGCFQKHHESNSMFLQKQATQIFKNMPYFDTICKEIASQMNVLISQEHPQFLQFLNYLQAKMMNSLNKLINLQNASSMDSLPAKE